MDIETLVDEIMEAYESEPDTDFGNESINQAIRQQGIRAHIWDLLQDYTNELTPEEEE